MADMVTARKSKVSVCKKTVNVDDGTVQFAFGLKDQPPVATEVVTLGEFAPEIENRLNLFGRTEKFGNFYAGADGDPARAHQMFVEGRATLQEGKWSEGRDFTVPLELLIDASLAAYLKAHGKNVKREKVAEYLNGLDEDSYRTYSKRKDIAAALAAIRAETSPTPETSLTDMFA